MAKYNDISLAKRRHQQPTAMTTISSINKLGDICEAGRRIAET